MSSHLPSEQTATGEFQRQKDAFREWISKDRSTSYPAAPGRYHLYVSLACPWASRTIIFRKLKGLEDVIGLTIVDPFRDEKGWAFRDPELSKPGSDLKKLDNFDSTDPVNGFRYLSEAYRATDPKFDGRVTVPVLWDKQTNKIVNNCEDDICPMFNDVFNDFAKNKDVDLFPRDIAVEQAKLSDFLYENINNGVYRAGFATHQKPYERACQLLFDALDEMERRLTSSRYLFGNRIVEADWRLFCTLIRFDVVYHGHFKCNLRRVIDYPNLRGYMLDLYQQPGIDETVSIDHIKRHYYMTHEEINPTRIVPLGPIIDLTKAHGREKL
jgi:glutathionyl-hydroquinone reductase